MLIPILKRLLPIVFLFSHVLFADDQNTSLINADKATYSTLLKSLNQSKLTDDETALQKVLLQKLITTPVQSPVTSLNLPQNSDEYSNLFNQYLDDTLKKDALVKKTKSITIKIATLEKEIKNLDANATSLHTLQLQDALYTKSLQDIKEQSESISAEIVAIQKLLNESLKNLSFDSNVLAKNTTINQENASKIRTTINNFLVKKERFELLGDTVDRGVSTNVISAKEESYTKALKATIGSLFLEFSDALKSKNKKAFILEKNILDTTSELDNANVLKESLASLLHNMENNYFGTLGTIQGSTMQEIKNIFTLSWKIMSDPMFTLNGSPISLLKMLLAVLVVILGVFIGGFYKTSIQKITMTSKSINLATRTILANLGYYAITITAFFVALNIIGINLSSVALLAGALSVGIGFGLQNIVSNFVSGIILMFERSIKVGDFVELSDTLRGHVTDIRMRSTTVNANGNIDIIVPNRNFIENNVINWTMHDKLKRFDMSFGVAYGTKPEEVIDIIIQAVAQKAYHDVINTPERYTNVLMTNMGSSSVDFQLQVWIHGDEILAPKKTTSRFLILIYNTLNEHGIEIPFPQQDVHIKNIPKEMPFMRDNERKA